MNHAGKILTMVTLVLAGAALLAFPQFASTETEQQTPAMDHGAQSASEPVPAFHAQPPEGDAGIARAIAPRCHCDRSNGHGSLLDCFASRHGAGCDTCIKEAFYSYEQTHKGKTPAQIREGIVRGDWQKVDLAKYQKDYLPPVSASSK